MRSYVVATLLLVGVTSVALEQVTSGVVTPGVYKQAWESGNVSAMLDLFDPNAKITSSRGVFEGEEEIEEYIKAIIDASKTKSLDQVSYQLVVPFQEHEEVTYTWVADSAAGKAKAEAKAENDTEEGTDAEFTKTNLKEEPQAAVNSKDDQAEAAAGASADIDDFMCPVESESKSKRGFLVEWEAKGSADDEDDEDDDMTFRGVDLVNLNKEGKIVLLVTFAQKADKEVLEELRDEAADEHHGVLYFMSVKERWQIAKPHMESQPNQSSTAQNSSNNDDRDIEKDDKESDSDSDTSKSMSIPEFMMKKMASLIKYLSTFVFTMQQRAVTHLKEHSSDLAGEVIRRRMGAFADDDNAESLLSMLSENVTLVVNAKSLSKGPADLMEYLNDFGIKAPFAFGQACVGHVMPFPRGFALEWELPGLKNYTSECTNDGSRECADFRAVEIYIVAEDSILKVAAYNFETDK